MSIAEHIKSSLQLPTFVVNGYLEDLTDADLLVRPAEKSNHINWQLGHLIQSEQFHTSQVCPDVVPELPAGFKERYTKETVSSDNPADFLSKAELVELMHKQREVTLNAACSRIGKLPRPHSRMCVCRRSHALDDARRSMVGYQTHYRKTTAVLTRAGKNQEFNRYAK